MNIRYPIITADAIKGFFGPYRWLSNFHVAPVVFEGLTYPSSEHAYQAAKYESERRIECLPMTCAEAKKWGAIAPNLDVEAWRGRSVEVMRRVVTDKFTRNSELRIRLVATAPLELVELNDWGDTFWGRVVVLPSAEWGENWLGKILMEVRSALLER